jgi:hypothetical protein
MSTWSVVAVGTNESIDCDRVLNAGIERQIEAKDATRRRLEVVEERHDGQKILSERVFL